jgi:hypothetical protein
MNYVDGDLVFSTLKKKFGVIDLVHVDQTGHPMFPGCEQIIRINWENDSGVIHYSSLYWTSTFEVEIQIGSILILGNPSQQDKLAILIKYS